MPYLIDGNNLIGHLPDLDLGDRKSRSRLLARLRRFQRFKNTRVIIVFDGAPDPNLITPSKHREAFSVRFPDPGQKADHLIEDIIAEQTDLRRFFVVSSDREIRRFARGRGARSVGCDDFYRELKATLRESREEEELEKDEGSPSPLEVRQWEGLFEEKP